MYRVLRSLLVALGLMVFAAGYGWASDVDIPNTFTSGTTAVAAEVNANFNAVKEAVDDNDARITTNTGDISDLQAQLTGLLPTVNMDSYKPQSGLVKTMSYTDFMLPTDDPYYTQDITVTWNGSTYMETWEYEDGRVYKFNYIPDSQGFLWSAWEIWDSTPQLTYTYDLDPPLVTTMLSGNMIIGGSWGGASVATQTDIGMGTTSKSGNVRMFTILGIEDITVPAGTFQDCLKIYRNPDGSMYWLAPGIGWVKRISSSQSWELESIQ